MQCDVNEAKQCIVTEKCECVMCTLANITFKYTTTQKHTSHTIFHFFQPPSSKRTIAVKQRPLDGSVALVPSKNPSNMLLVEFDSAVHCLKSMMQNVYSSIV